MAAGETARLIASLELQDKLSPGMKNAAKNVKGFTGSIARSRAVAVGLGVGMERLATSAIRTLGSQLGDGIQSLAQLESAITSVDGAIKTMGLTGKITGTQIAETANQIEASIGAAFDDKDITRATATLIRFGKVTPANLKQAMTVMTDLAARTGSVDSAASLLAKALADPTKAAGRLGRAGLILTKAEQKQIKAFIKAGDVAKAQGYILERLQKTTKGAAAATQGPYQRAISTLRDVTEDAQKALAEGFLPVIEKVAKILSTQLAKPEVLAQIREFGQGLARGLDQVLELAGKIPWGTIGDSLRIAGAGAKAVLDAFLSLPPWVQTAVITGWGLNKLSGGILGDVVGDLSKGLIKGVLGMNAGVVNINAGTVNGLPGGVGGAGGGMSGLGKLATLTIVTGAVALSAESIQGFADQNQQLKDKGLNAAEIAAMKYYSADTATQQQMFKRLGRIPEKSDWISALGKLNKATTETSPGKAADDLVKVGAKTKDVQALKDITTSWLTRNHQAAGKIADDVVRAKDAQVGATRNAEQGIKGATYASGAMVSATIRANRPIVNTKTDIRINVTASGITKTVSTSTRYGPSNGSAGGNAWPGGEKI